jgi:hypothetical protein
MTAGGPPLGRILTYVRVLERLRKREDSVSLPSFVDAVEELPPKVVRSDLQALGVDLRAGSALDVHAAYWSIVKSVPAAEQREIDEGATLSVPTADETLAKIPRSPAESHVAAFARGKGSAAAAAQALDLSFDVAVENPDLFLLGHGRMHGSHVAFRHQVATARQVAEDMKGLAIVADEVGLGKTNIAALILEEILTGDPDATALVLVPANVKPQWIDELSKFFGRELLSDIKGLSYPELESVPVLLLSLDQAKGTGKDSAVSEILRKRMWDLLVDENLKQLAADRSAFDWSQRDPQSIMIYGSDPKFLKKGTHSPCYFHDNNSLSKLDIVGIEKTYPIASAKDALKFQSATVPIVLDMKIPDNLRKALETQNSLVKMQLDAKNR